MFFLPLPQTEHTTRSSNSTHTKQQAAPTRQPHGNGRMAAGSNFTLLELFLHESELVEVIFPRQRVIAGLTSPAFLSRFFHGWGVRISLYHSIASSNVNYIFLYAFHGTLSIIAFDETLRNAGVQTSASGAPPGVRIDEFPPPDRFAHTMSCWAKCVWAR